MDFNNFEFEDKESKRTISNIANKISSYDVYDVISRIAGLNVLSENQNKSVLSDTLIQNILEKPRNYYTSKIKMSDRKFRVLMEELNDTFVAAAIDPCENVCVQNVMFNGGNYRVFNGLDITPAYNLQAMIRVLFGYSNNYNSDFLAKIYRLYSLLLTISERIVSASGITLENAVYSEERKIIIPSAKKVKECSCYVNESLESVVNYIDGYFNLNELCIEFGTDNHGDLNNRSFYSNPFLVDEQNGKIIILNVSLLPEFALYKAFEWADEYGIREQIIKDYNDYIWFECKKNLELLEHSKINERAYGVECISNSFYKESIHMVFNNQLMFVFYYCDDGDSFSAHTLHEPYPNTKHQNLMQRRLNYFEKNLKKLDISKEDTYCLTIINSIGRSMAVGIKSNPFGYRPISLNPFELSCVTIHERDDKSFIPRYIRAKNQLQTFGGNFFSELNAICIYTSNHNTFYMNDDLDPETTNVYIAPSDSIKYITESLVKEHRMLLESYDGNAMEVMLMDKYRNIFVENRILSEKYIALCVVYPDLKIWIKTDEIESLEAANIYYSFADTISYWLAESRNIIEMYDFPFDIYTIHLSIKGDAKEFYFEMDTKPFEECITKKIENNHIFLEFSPNAFGNLNHVNNLQEKELCRYIIDIFDNSAYENVDYKLALDRVFQNPLKKKFFSAEYESEPYLQPPKIRNYRTIHSEDVDFLLGIIGKDLLSSGEWNIGIVEDEKRTRVTNIVVGWLFKRLEEKVAEFEPNNILEFVYQDVEETIYRLVLAQNRFYSDIVCYPEKEKECLKAFNELNSTSMALKFLIEYLTACPPKGKKHFGIGEYEELLAICSMILEWAYKGDLFYYNIFNTPIEFLKSRRIGMKRDEFEEMYQYNDMFRQRQLRYDSSEFLRKEYEIEVQNFDDELDVAYEAEFGYKYTEFASVIITMELLADDDVVCINNTDIIHELLIINSNLTERLIKAVLDDITYTARGNYLKLPKGYDKEDAYPWRFNRQYSFMRRPVLARDESLIWGKRHLYQSVEYVYNLIYSGKFKAKSEEMKSLIGRITKNRGAVFNELIVQMIRDMNYFDIFPNVKKVNGKRIAENGGDLGDIDILLVDKADKKIIVTEVKNFRFSRNPREINYEYQKMFVDEGGKPCFATKHEKRKRWIEEHIQDVCKEYRLNGEKWNVTALFIVNQPLVSQHLFNEKIKCISKAELTLEALNMV